MHVNIQILNMQIKGGTAHSNDVAPEEEPVKPCAMV